MTPLFELQSLSVRLGQTEALKNIDLTITPGSHVALIGANGSGKSTLLRVLHGLIAPTSKPFSGQLRVNPEVRQAMLFQRPHMLRMSVLANVALGAWLGGSTKPGWTQAKTQALDALERVGLRAEARRPARALSQGQQQRVALARAWVMQPNVLLLDEPTASMDPHAKREVEHLMAEFAKHSGMSLVFASHNLGQVKRLATHVAYLEHGQLLAYLPVAQFFDPTCLRQYSERADAFLKGDFT